MITKKIYFIKKCTNLENSFSCFLYLKIVKDNLFKSIVMREWHLHTLKFSYNSTYVMKITSQRQKWERSE